MRAVVTKPALWMWSLFAVSAVLAASVCMRSSSSPTQADAITIHVKLAPGLVATAADTLQTATPHPIEAIVALFPSAPTVQAGALMPYTGKPMPDLQAWWRIRVKAPQHRAAQVVAGLLGHERVVAAFVPPDYEPAVLKMPAAADDSCPIKTPSYQRHQGYLGTAPHGIDAPAAWAVPGGRGEGMWVADVEGAWNVDHEDLPGGRMEHVAGRVMGGRGWESHGTAVLGEIAARDNGIGMVGIVPNVERIFTASIGDIGAASALYIAATRLRAGDVLIIELHARGPRGRFLPVEYWDDIYDVVTYAVGRGVVVVAAAGNGGENLDHRAYRGRLTRSVRDSGAILVGAGAPATEGFVDRSRLWFSNYGSRVDVQGWGRMVATLDYGDLQNCDATDRKYTNEFGGTSSATPVVAGAVLALQGILRASTGRVLSPLTMRALLRRTGSPQVDGPEGAASQSIGPRPDLARALPELETAACRDEFSETESCADRRIQPDADSRYHER